MILVDPPNDLLFIFNSSPSVESHTTQGVLTDAEITSLMNDSLYQSNRAGHNAKFMFLRSWMNIP